MRPKGRSDKPRRYVNTTLKQHVMPCLSALNTGNIFDDLHINILGILNCTGVNISSKGRGYMRTTNPNASLSKPRWDGSRVLFEIEVAGEAVPCAISRSALQNLSGRRHFASADLLRGFATARAQIEEIAAGKFRASPESVSGIVSIWDDDVDTAPSSPTEVAPLAQGYTS